MREFDYSHISDELRDNDVCNLISAIREYRGKQTLFISAKPDVLKTLLEMISTDLCCLQHLSLQSGELACTGITACMQTSL